MDVIEQLRQLQDELTARGLCSVISDKAHWFTLDPVPTLTCCTYLGRAQVTVTTDGLYQWLDGEGNDRTHPSVHLGRIVNALVLTRAGTSTPTELPEGNRPPPGHRPPLPRRGDERPHQGRQW
ncbi:hypothetical protein KGD82_08220 [Nocardiopsis eucommiae]|uniref:Uncharacterized protein n=1 Tax=Nocardiopsis eucommiae TaxID=2831970 RepID=A0A975LC24_9ACTN|nr:hypothetical protein KGD82_08220 [Nocardiopsis eucommiae]